MQEQKIGHRGLHRKKVFSHEFHEWTRISSLEPAEQFVLIRDIRGKEGFLQQSHL